MVLNVRRILGVLVVYAIVLSGCGDSSDDNQSGSAATSQSSETSESSESSESTDSSGSSESSETTESSESSESSGSTSEAEESACVAPADGGDLKDQDFDDFQVPWERKGADKVTIYFESQNVTDEYIPHLEAGAVAWNKSPCLDVQIVDSCPGNSNCITVSVTPGDDADGNFDDIERDGFTVGGHIDLYFEELDKLGDGAKLNVTIHEMGHAVGLRHRLSERVLMNGDTYTDIFDPDEIDYYNLLVLYGNQ